MISFNHIYLIKFLDHLTLILILDINDTFSIYDFRRKLVSAEPIKKQFIFSENIPAGIYDYALKLTNKMIGMS